MQRHWSLLLTRIASGCCGLSATLGSLLHGVFLSAVAAVVLTLRCLSLTDILRRLGTYLSAEQDSYGATVEVVEHAAEDIERLELVDE